MKEFGERCGLSYEHFVNGWYVWLIDQINDRFFGCLYTGEDYGFFIEKIDLY